MCSLNIAFRHFKIDVLKPNQGEAFFYLIDSNRARLEDFFAGTVAKTKTLEDTIGYCKEIQQRIKDRSYFPYLIIDTNTNTFIGLVDVKNIDCNVPKAELGYFIDVKYEGQGVISEAVKYIVEYLTVTYKFRKLLCRVGSKNEGSIHVALKNDFELEGSIRSDYKTTRGEIVDLNYYGRVFVFND